MRPSARFRERGFLPFGDPDSELGPEYAVWDHLGREMPKLLAAGKLRDRLDQLEVLEVHKLHGDAQLERAMTLLSFLGHGYVWQNPGPAGRLPAGVAVPWSQVARILGRPPVLSYASYILNNWRRLDPKDNIELGNIGVLQNFFGGLDEEWFILVHVDIEAKAGATLQAAVQAQQSVDRDDTDDLEHQIGTALAALQRIYQILLRMPENCDPYIYYHRVRPYIQGWKDNPSLPDGILYEGADEYRCQRQKFRGETGAQSSLIPSLDAFLGIRHQEDP